MAKLRIFISSKLKKLSGFRESEAKKENEDLNDSDYFSPSLFKENSTGSTTLNWDSTTAYLGPYRFVCWVLWLFDKMYKSMLYLSKYPFYNDFYVSSQGSTYHDIPALAR